MEFLYTNNTSSLSAIILHRKENTCLSLKYKGLGLFLVFLMSFVNNQNLSAQACGTCAAANCIGVKQYANKPAAQAGVGKVWKNYAPTLNNTNGSFTIYTTVTTDANGQVAVMQELQIQGPTTNITTQIQALAATRTYALYAPTDASCTTPLPANILNDGCSTTFNPGWTNLLPNTNYKLALTTNLTNLDAAYTYMGFNVRFYNSVRPVSTFTFNCGTAAALGTFVANGVGGQAGTLTVPITSATAGSATFTVTGTGFSGSTAINVATGQTSVSIPIIYDGSGAAGARTLTVTSSQGTGACTPSVTVTALKSSFAFNCGTAATTGTFTANGTTGQSGTITIPLSNATAGTATFSVSGGGFSGSLSTTLTAGQTSVSFPITYNGSGASGNHLVSITSPQGTGTCALNVAVGTPNGSFTFNCGTASVAGTFIANGTTGQSGFVTVPMTGAVAGSVTINVTGTGFTGSLTTILTTNQTQVSIPITYNGSGSGGTVPLSITSSQGTGTCAPNATVTASSTPGGITFNCPTTASVIGSFTANGAVQKGLMSVSFTTQTIGQITVTVSGNGFSGSYATSVIAGQTSITMPVTYDGTGAAGNHAITVTSSQATGTCAMDIPVQDLFAFNCTNYNTSSNFTADATSQSGTLVIPLSNAFAGSATFSVSGNGFTGSLTTVLKDSQRFVAIPVVYDGSGAAGIHAVTVTSSQSSGTCTANVKVKDPAVNGCDFLFGQSVSFNIHSQTTYTGYSTQYILVDASGVIKYQTATLPFTGVAIGDYDGYAVNYSGTAPTLTVGTNISAIGGTCTNLSNALSIKVCAGYQFSCGSATYTGAFLANGVSGQTGTLYITVLNALAIPTTINVANGGFVGSITQTLTVGQNVVALPVTYDGTGAGGTVLLTISGLNAYGTCTMGVSVFPPAPVSSFAFTCGSATLDGTFVANGALQSGSVTLSLTGVVAGTTNFTVSGTGFSGGLTNVVLTAGQTSISIPVEYNGQGPAGTYTVIINSPKATASCSTSIPVYDNTDTDGDGIIDGVDIDDDNDGILDTAETGCFAFPSKSSITATTGLGFVGAVSELLNSAEANTFYFAIQTVSNSNIAEFTFPNLANLTKIEITTDVSSSFLANGLTYKVQGWNGTAYVDLTAVLTSNGTNTATTTGGSTFSKIFDLSSNTAFYSKYKILGISGSISNAPYVREAHFTGSYSCTEADTDNDGLVNRLDLDSDNDGCSDAQEGGATTILTANYQFTGTFGTNGLDNSLETVADNGIINYTSAYSRAIDANLKACTDTDGDGIINLIDIDDDNDGVLDLVENNCANPFSATTYPACLGSSATSIDWESIGTTLTGGGTFTNNLLGTVTVSGTGTSNIRIGTTNNSGTYLNCQNNGHTLTFTWTKPVTSMIIPVGDMDFNENVTFSAAGATFAPISLGPTDSWTAPNVVSGTGDDLNSVPENYSTIQVTAPAGITSLQMVFGAIGLTGTNSILDFCVTGMLTPCNADIDNDGITNDLDLDSDGDGCSDAFEAGATTNTTTNFKFTGTVGVNGLDNSLETVADNGTINYTSTYSKATDSTQVGCISVAGSVYHDNGVGGGTASNCVKDGTEGGVTLPSGMYVKLKNIKDTFDIQAVPVAADGSFSLVGVKGTFKIFVDNNNVLTDTVPTLPRTWSGTNTWTGTIANGIPTPAFNFCMVSACTNGTVTDTMYAVNSTGTLLNAGVAQGATGAPNATYYNVSSSGTTNQSILTYGKTFNAGDSIYITAKWHTAAGNDSIKIDFSANGVIYTTNVLTVNGFNVAGFTTKAFAVPAMPGTIVGSPKYIRIQGKSATTSMNIDAVRVDTIRCAFAPVSGLAYNDNGAGGGTKNNCTKDGTEGGATLPTGLYAKLKTAAGTTAYRAGVLAADGTFSITDVADGTYTAFVDNNNTLSDITATLPTDWTAPSLTVTVTNGVASPALSFCMKFADNDGDGIGDSVDIDDDNDGVPDVVENLSCTNTNNNSVTGTGAGVNKGNLYWFNWTDPAFSNGLQNGDAQTFTLTDGTLVTATFSNVSGNAASQIVPIDMQTWSGAYAYQLYNTTGTKEALYPSAVGTNTLIHFDVAFTATKSGNPVNLNLVFTDAEATGPAAAQGTETMYAITNGGNWKELENIGTPTINGIGTNTVNVISTLTGNKILYSENATTITFNTTSGVGSAGRQAAAFGLVLNCDADGDGIANSIDTDSDNDGCSDAFESGATTITDANYTFPGPYGANGLADAKETTPESGVVNYTSTYSNATDNTIHTCPACAAGTTAPAITQTTATNPCPVATVNLATMTNTGTKPTNTTLIWSTHNTPTTAGDTLTSLVVSTSGKYYAFYYDKAFGCYSPADSVTVTINAVPTTPTTTVTQPTCSTATGTITVNTPSSGVTYSFDNGTNYQASNIKSGLTASATYQIIVKDNTTGCISATTPSVIDAVLSVPSAPTTSVTQPTCSVSTGTITVTAPSSGVTYSFDNGTTYQASNIKSGLAAATTYQVIVKDNTSGCASTATPSVINAALSVPSAPTTSVTQPTCSVSTGTITVNTPSSGVTYSFDNGATYQASNIKSGLAASTTYQVIVKDDISACVSTATPSVINTAPSCGDADGDGIVDSIDLDDDNDGVLDRTEDCFGYRSINQAGAWNGNTASTFGITFAGSATQTVSGNLNDNRYTYHVNTNGGIQRLAKSDNVSITATFSPAIPASEIGFYLQDVDYSNGSTAATYTITTNGGAPSSFVQVMPTDGLTQMTYNATTGVASLNGTGNDQEFVLRGNTSDLISTITITSTGISVIDLVAYSFFGYKTCDTDGDNIPDVTDLDSDNDGCSDAYESGATTNITSNYSFTGAVGANGLIDTKETAVDNGIINYTSTYSNATNSAIKNCCPHVIARDTAICLGNSVDLANLYTQDASTGTVTHYANYADAVAKTSALSSSAVTPSVTSKYFIRKENLANCFDIDSINIVINALPSTPTTTVIQPTCGVATGTITVNTPSSGVTYSFDNGTNYQASNIKSGLAAGATYQIIVKDNTTGCISVTASSVINAALTVPSAPTTAVTQPTCSVATGTITVAPISGAMYSFDNGANYQASNVKSGLAAATTYQVIVKDNTSGCTSTATATVINAALAVPTAPTTTVTQPTCGVTTGTITVTAPSSGVMYSFDNGTTYQASNIKSGLAAATTYQVIVKDNTSGCTSTATATVINAALAVPTAPTTTVTQPTCGVTTGTITVTAPSSGVMYSFDNGTTYQASNIKSGLAAATTYQVIVKDNTSGCASTSAPSVINAALTVPSAPTTTVTQPSCSLTTGTITVTAPSSGVTYSFDNGTTYQASNIKSGLAAATTYQVIAKDNTSGCASAATPSVMNAVLTVPNAPTTTVVQPTCFVSTGSITITDPTGTGITYSIDGSNYTNTTGVFSTVASGTYNVTAKGTNGCVSPSSSVTINSLVSPPVVTITQPTCGQVTGSFSVTSPVGGGFSYSIDGVDYSNTSGVFTNLPISTYTVTAKNASGCISNGTTFSINPPVPTPVVSITQPTCSVATATITVTAPSSGMSYSFDNGTTYQASNIKSGLVAGATYQVIAKDSTDGCLSAATSAVINAQPASPVVTSTTVTDPTQASCPLGNDGTITINATGLNLEYSKDSGTTWQTANVFAGLSAGTYKTLVRNTASSCTVPTNPATITIAPLNCKPSVADSLAVTTPQDSAVTTCTTITDANLGDTFAATAICSTQHGTAVPSVVGNQLCVTYIPTTGYVGKDSVCIKVCDQGGLCDTIVFKFTVQQACITFNLKVLLEGPFSTTTNLMSTTLNDRGLLPGQTPIGGFAVPTPSGQPYATAPWYYNGSETVTTYPADVVDWVLVSLRTSPVLGSTVFRAAGLLHSNGAITFTNPCINLPNGSFYIVIEHRNHLGVMSPSAVTVLNNTISFDFTTGQSYVLTNPPSFGQKVKGTTWVMYAADGKKTTTTMNFDINFSDSQLWKLESGIFDQYRFGDFNMDADVNFLDSQLWKLNNGRYSGVPH